MLKRSRVRWFVLGLPLLFGCAAIPFNDQQTYRLSTLERAVVDEMNLARTQPQTYRVFLEHTRRYYSGTYFRRPGSVALITQEGLRAVDEAIRFLRTVQPVPPLTVSRGLSLGARDHRQDQGSRGTTGHQSSDGSRPWDRAKRYGAWQGTIGENIAYGQETAREVVMALIIDDGVPGRGHRTNLFNVNFRVTGVACGAHAIYRTMCVMTLAGTYVESEAR